jgi:hypothetical protein
MHMHAHMCRLRMWVIKTGIWSQAPIQIVACNLSVKLGSVYCWQFRITHWEHFRACSYMIIHILLVLTNPRPRSTLGNLPARMKGARV